MTHLIFERIYVKSKVMRRNKILSELNYCVVVYTCLATQKKDVRMLPTPLLKVAFGHQNKFLAPSKKWDNFIKKNQNKLESIIFSKSNIRGWEQREKISLNFLRKQT